MIAGYNIPLALIFVPVIYITFWVNSINNRKIATIMHTQPQQALQVMPLIDIPEGGKKSGIGEIKVIKMPEQINRQKTQPTAPAKMTCTYFQTL